MIYTDKGPHRSLMAFKKIIGDFVIGFNKEY